MIRAACSSGLDYLSPANYKHLSYRPTPQIATAANYLRKELVHRPRRSCARRHERSWFSLHHFLYEFHECDLAREPAKPIAGLKNGIQIHLVAARSDLWVLKHDAPRKIRERRSAH